MNWKLSQLLYISDWSKFVGPKLDFILDQTHCIWAYWVTGFILAIGPAGMAINKFIMKFLIDKHRICQIDRFVQFSCKITNNYQITLF
jgi:hypothetical protein